jgi:hypothetical protein
MSAIPLHQVLTAVSRELENLGAQATQLEQSVSQNIAANKSMSDRMICEMQSLDRVNQGLQDLAVLTKEIAKHVSTNSLTPAQSITISDAVRLTSTKGMVSLQRPKQEDEVPEPSVLDIF